MSASFSPFASVPSHRIAMLDQEVRGVMFCFNLSSTKLVSKGLRWTTAESDPPHSVGKADFPDSDARAERQFLRSGANVDLAGFVDELHAAGFVMTSAEGRTKNLAYAKEGVAWSKTHHRVRFIFHRESLEYPLESSMATYLKLHGESALTRLSKESMWSIEGFRNPLRGEEGTGISLQCSNRTPLYLRPGVPCVRWQKDANGERIGNEPIPVTPRAYLRLVEGRIIVE